MELKNNAHNGSDPRILNEWKFKENINDFFKDYRNSLGQALDVISIEALKATYHVLKTVSEKKGFIFTAGNGGSAAIANHLCCDWTKGTYIENKVRLKTYSLCSNVELMTAISNDFGNDEVFSRQLKMLVEPNDALVLISSSGNSPNVIHAAKTAKDLKIPIIGFTGFSGGKLKDLADISIHVEANNYGTVEDAHQIIMQSIAQYFFLSSSKELNGNSNL